MDIKDVKIGQRLKIVNGWASEFLGHEIIILDIRGLYGGQIAFRTIKEVSGYPSKGNKWMWYSPGCMVPVVNKVDPRPEWM
jgi:hypothetical protein